MLISCGGEGLSNKPWILTMKHTRNYLNEFNLSRHYEFKNCQSMTIPWDWHGVLHCQLSLTSCHTSFCGAYQSVLHQSARRRWKRPGGSAKLAPRWLTCFNPKMWRIFSEQWTLGLNPWLFSVWRMSLASLRLGCRCILDFIRCGAESWTSSDAAQNTMIQLCSMHFNQASPAWSCSSSKLFS